MTDIIDKKTARALQKERDDIRKKAEADAKRAAEIEDQLTKYNNSSLIKLLTDLKELLDSRQSDEKFDSETKKLSNQVNVLINPPTKKKKVKSATAGKKQTKISDGMETAILELLKSNPDKKFKRGEIDEEVFEDAKVQTLNAVDWREFKDKNADKLSIEGKLSGQTVQWAGK
jgi:hypothetical protein